jgi:hypothetical protein
MRLPRYTGLVLYAGRSSLTRGAALRKRLSAPDTEIATRCRRTPIDSACGGTVRIAGKATLAILAVTCLGLTLTHAETAAEPPAWRLAARTADMVTYTSSTGAEVGWISAGHPAASSRSTSASGCNANVCIQVTGEGLFVSRWATQAFGNVGCTKAWFHAQLSSVTSPTICPTGSGSGTYFYNAGPAGYYQDGEDLCNTWDRIEGYPCIEVHD